jgi:hypothetical protein
VHHHLPLLLLLHADHQSVGRVPVASTAPYTTPPARTLTLVAAAAAARLYIIHTLAWLLLLLLDVAIAQLNRCGFACGVVCRRDGARAMSRTLLLL